MRRRRGLRLRLRWRLHLDRLLLLRRLLLRWLGLLLDLRTCGASSERFGPRSRNYRRRENRRDLRLLRDGR